MFCIIYIYIFSWIENLFFHRLHILDFEMLSIETINQEKKNGNVVRTYIWIRPVLMFRSWRSQWFFCREEFRSWDSVMDSIQFPFLCYKRIIFAFYSSVSYNDCRFFCSCIVRAECLFFVANLLKHFSVRWTPQCRNALFWNVIEEIILTQNKGSLLICLKKKKPFNWWGHLQLKKTQSIEVKQSNIKLLWCNVCFIFKKFGKSQNIWRNIHFQIKTIKAGITCLFYQ